MTIFREYGPFKGIHNSSSNLIAKENFVLDARNVFMDKNDGYFRKRPGVTLAETLAAVPFGIAFRIKDSQIGTEDLFIAGTKGQVKTSLASAATDILQPFSDALLAKATGDYFSSFVYQNALYYCYGDYIYKYDGKYNYRAGIKSFEIRSSGAGLPAKAGNAYKFLLQIADNQNEFATFTEFELKDVDLVVPAGSAHANAIFGFLIGDDFLSTNTQSWYKTTWFIPSVTPYVEGDYVDTTLTDFTVEHAGTNCVVGDKVFILSNVAGAYASTGLNLNTDYQYRLFEVKTVTATTITFKNPLKLEILIQMPGTNFPNNSSFVLSNAVLYCWHKAPTASVYSQSLNIGRSLISIHGVGAIITQVDGPSPPYMSGFADGTGTEYEYPEFTRSALPRGKHISNLNDLMFITCPKVWSQNVGVPEDDFDYQSVAWSSENPEDPIETWGGSSVVVGDPTEGRCFATVPNTGALVVFKDKAIYTMEYPVDGQTTIQKAAGSTVGCSHPESIVEVNGVLLFYVEKKGIYAYRAGNAQADELTGGFRKFFTSLTGQAKAVVDTLNSKYICTINGYAIVFDILTNAWWIWTMPTCDGGLTYFSDKVVGVDGSKRIFSLESAVLKDNLGSDVAIDGYVLSNWFAGFDNETDKKLKAIRVWALEKTDPILVSVYKNFKSSTVDSSATINSDSTDIDIAGFMRYESGLRKFKALAIKFENNTVNEDFRLSGWAIDYEPTGFESKNFTGAN